MGNELSILNKDVVQANPLIEARKSMNVTEMRMFVLGLQDIKPHIKDDKIHDVEFHETVIPYSDLMNLFGKEFNGNVSNLKSQVKKASSCVIELSSQNGGFGFAAIYRKIKYEPNKGLIIHFNDELKPYILELVNQAYTKYKVKAFFSLSSSYAWRILESLLEYQGFFKKGEKKIFWETDIENFDVLFALAESYRTGNGVKKNIDKAIAWYEQIINYCDFAINSDLAIFYNIFSDNFGSEARINGAPTVIYDFDADDLKELEEKLSSNLSDQLKKIREEAKEVQ